MSISPINSVTNNQSWPPPTGGKDPLSSVTSLLGESKDELISDLKSGKSLDDIAKSKGISHDDLIKAIVSGLPSQLQSGADATQIAEKIADTQGLPKTHGHHHHHHHGGGDSQGAVGAAAPAQPAPNSGSTTEVTL